VDICPDRAVILDDHGDGPCIDEAACMLCGKCVSACPTGTIIGNRRAYRVLLGGKLGRHPRLAVELPGLFDTDDVVKIVGRCLAFYKANSRGGRRFADIFTPVDIDYFLGTASENDDFSVTR
jgi:dissimilatory sulfite reductase (desulfoviridin) alpha/beta subunit